MDKLSRLVGVAACAGVIATAACSGNSSSLTPSAAGPSVGMQVRADGQHPSANAVYMPTRFAPQPAVHQDTLLTYRGGPVLLKPTMYLIFWGFKANGDPNQVKALMVAYAKHIGKSALNNVLTQYYSGSGSTQQFIANPGAQFGGAYSDNTNAIPAHPTDAQVAAESLVGVAHFGYNANASYVVVTAHNHYSIGFATSWCAYHSATQYNGQLVSYTNLPYMADGGQNCGANIISPPSDESGADEGQTIVAGHEYAESVTDPNPPTGWYDNNGGEIGDKCAWDNIQNDPFKKGSSYTSQPEWSNANNQCEHSY
jgi:hypothetical protein